MSGLTEEHALEAQEHANSERKRCDLRNIQSGCRSASYKRARAAHQRHDPVDGGVGCEGEPEEREWAQHDTVQPLPQVFFWRRTMAKLFRPTAVIPAELLRQRSMHDLPGRAHHSPCPNRMREAGGSHAEAERNVGEADDLHRAGHRV